MPFRTARLALARTPRLIEGGVRWAQTKKVAAEGFPLEELDARLKAPGN
jgi:hypothetical protein